MRISMLLQRSSAALLLLCAGQSAHALDNSFEIGAGIGSSSNVARVPVNPQRETIDVLGGKIVLAQTRSRLEFAALGALEFQKYQGDVFDHELIGNFRARVIGTLAPERVHWLGEYYFGQTPIDSFGAPSPANRQNINAFSTGPSFNQPLGVSNRLRADLLYTDFQYQVSRLNTRREALHAALVHDFSARAHLSLNTNVQQAKLTQQTNFAHFDQQEGYGRLALSNSRSLLNLDLGYTRVRDGQGWNGATLARLMTLRRLSSTTSVSLALGRAYSDSAASFVQQQSLSGDGSTGTTATQNIPDQFLNEFATAGWSLKRNRTEVRIDAMHFRETYQRLTINNRKRSLGSITFGREFTDSLGAELHGIFERQQFEVSNHAFDERTAGAGINWRPGRTLTLRASFDRIKRVGDTLIPSYDDTQIWLRLGYVHGSLAAMTAASTLRDASMMDAAAALDRDISVGD